MYQKEKECIKRRRNVSKGEGMYQKEKECIKRRRNVSKGEGMYQKEKECIRRRRNVSEGGMYQKEECIKDFKKLYQTTGSHNTIIATAGVF